jgi:methionine--tRNA ligase beta chain
MTFEEFQRIELRVGKVVEADAVGGSEKLVRLRVRLGDPTLGAGMDDRQIVAGIGKRYKPEDLLNKQIVIVANLEPKTIMGLESRGMLLAAHDEDGSPVVLIPDKPVPSGSSIS